jgi:hypothetical protein
LWWWWGGIPPPHWMPWYSSCLHDVTYVKHEGMKGTWKNMHYTDQPQTKEVCYRTPCLSSTLPVLPGSIYACTSQVTDSSPHKFQSPILLVKSHESVMSTSII